MPFNAQKYKKNNKNIAFLIKYFIEGVGKSQIINVLQNVINRLIFPGLTIFCSYPSHSLQG